MPHTGGSEADHGTVDERGTVCSGARREIPRMYGGWVCGQKAATRRPYECRYTEQNTHFAMLYIHALAVNLPTLQFLMSSQGIFVDALETWPISSLHRSSKNLWPSGGLWPRFCWDAFAEAIAHLRTSKESTAITLFSSSTPNFPLFSTKRTVDTTSSVMLADGSLQSSLHSDLCSHGSCAHFLHYSLEINLT